MVADLAAQVFRDRAPRALLLADAAPTAALGWKPTAVADATAPAAADAAAEAAAPAPTSPLSIRFESAKLRLRGRRDGQRKGLGLRPHPALWAHHHRVQWLLLSLPGRPPQKPDLQVEPEKPLAVEDSVANDAYVVAALGQACALPRDKENLGIRRN